MKHNSILIQKQHAVSKSERLFWGGVTAVFWVIYVYLWMPLITLAMWLIGIRSAALELYFRVGRVDSYLLLTVPLIAAICMSVLSGWAEYNRRRFSGNDRRTAPQPAELAEIAKTLGASSDVVMRMQSGKRMILRMSDDARPIAMVDRSNEEKVNSLKT